MVFLKTHTYDKFEKKLVIMKLQKEFLLFAGTSSPIDKEIQLHLTSDRKIFGSV